MKTPKGKAIQEATKKKFNTPLQGKVSKSQGNAINKKNPKIPLKNAQRALNSLIKEGPNEIKVKNKTGNLSPADPRTLKNTKPQNQITFPINKDQKNVSPVARSPKLPKKAKQANIFSDGHASDLKDTKSASKQKKKTVSHILTPRDTPQKETNSSPVKTAKGVKLSKPSFNLDLPDSGSTLSDQKNKMKVAEQMQTSNSDNNLGLETALSPKSKKQKKKKLLKNKLQTEGKVSVSTQEVKDDSQQKPSLDETEKSGKARKRRRRRSKSQNVQIPTESLLKPVNVKNGLHALLKTVTSSNSKKKELFNEDQYIYLQLNLLKSSTAAKGVLHVPLPNLIFPGSPDVLLITPDLKGKRNDPEEAIDFYKELLSKHDIDFVTEIIPIRKLKTEYSQFEEKTKLANRFDIILVDGRVNKMARIGRRFARSKKCVSAVKLDSKNLKNEFLKALRKVALFSSGAGNTYAIKCGRVGMKADNICDNIIEIGKALASDRIVIGDKKNISSIYIKTALSKSFPLYISTVSPNEVTEPKGKERNQEKPVRGEVTTVEGADVIVYPSGTVKVKKRKNENIEPEDEDVKQSSKSSKKSKAQNKSVEQNEDDESDDIDFEKLKQLLSSGASSGEESDGDDPDFKKLKQLVSAAEGSDDESDEGSDFNEMDDDSDDDIKDNDESEAQEDDEDSSESDNGSSLSIESDDDLGSSDSDAGIEEFEKQYLSVVQKLNEAAASNKPLKAKNLKTESSDTSQPKAPKSNKKAKNLKTESSDISQPKAPKPAKQKKQHDSGIQLKQGNRQMKKSPDVQNQNNKSKKKAPNQNINNKPSKNTALNGRGQQFKKNANVSELSKAQKKGK